MARIYKIDGPPDANENPGTPAPKSDTPNPDHGKKNFIILAAIALMALIAASN
jgi:hypothetical protein